MGKQCVVFIIIFSPAAQSRRHEN